MQFHNRENTQIFYKGKEVRDSRSTAVESVLFFKKDHERYIPLVLRGEKAVCGVGMRALPGGYIDWDESGFECLCRECREETGLDIVGLRPHCLNWNDGQNPFGVYTKPRGERQNIIIRNNLLFDVEELPELKSNVSVDEIKDTMRYKVEDTLKMELAFDHRKLIERRRDVLQQS